MRVWQASLQITYRLVAVAVSFPRGNNCTRPQDAKRLPGPTVDVNVNVNPRGRACALVLTGTSHHDCRCRCACGQIALVGRLVTVTVPVPRHMHTTKMRLSALIADMTERRKCNPPTTAVSVPLRLLPMQL